MQTLFRDGMGIIRNGEIIYTFVSLFALNQTDKQLKIVHIIQMRKI